MKIKALISNCCEASIIEETDICSRCKEHCEPQAEEQCYKLSGKMKEKDKLLKIIIEHYNLAKNGCTLTNRELAGYLAVEKLDDEKHIISSQRTSTLLSSLVKAKKIKINYLGHPRGKIIRLLDKVSQNEATLNFIKKYKKNT